MTSAQMRQAARSEAATSRHCGAAGANTVATRALTENTTMADCVAA
jgi:hypothetical protein